MWLSLSRCGCENFEANAELGIKQHQAKESNMFSFICFPWLGVPGASQNAARAAFLKHLLRVGHKVCAKAICFKTCCRLGVLGASANVARAMFLQHLLGGGCRGYTTSLCFYIIVCA